MRARTSLRPRGLRAVAVSATLWGASTAAAAPFSGHTEVGATLSSRSFRYTDTKPDTDLWSLSVPGAAGLRTQLEVRSARSLPPLLADWSLRATLETIPLVEVGSAEEATSLEALRARVGLGRRFVLTPSVAVSVHGGYHGHSTRSGLTPRRLPSLRSEAIEGGGELELRFSELSAAVGVAYRLGLGVGELGAADWFAGARFLGVHSFAEIGLVLTPGWTLLGAVRFDQSGYDFNPLSPSLEESRRAGGATDREVGTSLGIRYSWESPH